MSGTAVLSKSCYYLSHISYQTMAKYFKYFIAGLRVKLLHTIRGRIIHSIYFHVTTLEMKNITARCSLLIAQ